MGPKLDATKQAKKGAAVKITAYIDQISDKEGTTVWIFFFLIFNLLIMLILTKWNYYLEGKTYLKQYTCKWR